MKFSTTNRGFTLIELMVVITIIGLLASSILVALGNARAKARDGRRTADIRAMMTALELYANDTGSYQVGTTDCSGSTGCDISLLSAKLVPDYLDKMPVDPRSSTYGTYTFKTSGSAAAQNNYLIMIRYEKLLTVADTYCYRGTGFTGSQTVNSLTGTQCP